MRPKATAVDGMTSCWYSISKTKTAQDAEEEESCFSHVKPPQHGMAWLADELLVPA